MGGLTARCPKKSDFMVWKRKKKVVIWQGKAGKIHAQRTANPKTFRKKMGLSKYDSSVIQLKKRKKTK